jgi:hypothetical protein
VLRRFPFIDQLPTAVVRILVVIPWPPSLRVSPNTTVNRGMKFNESALLPVPWKLPTCWQCQAHGRTLATLVLNGPDFDADLPCNP